jgi:hypothetical protein
MAAIMALTSTVSSKWSNPFGEQTEEGSFEVPIKIETKKTGYSSAQANNLQTLYHAYGIYDQAYINKQLDSFYDIQIYSKIHFGENREEFKLIFDSGSAWVWVGGENCVNCGHKKFAHSESSTFKQQSYRLSTLKYGMGQIWGYDSTDTICLNPDSVVGNGCMEDFLFKTVVKEKDLEGIAASGLIGLAPNGGDGSQLFVPSLYEQGAIKKNLYAMYIDQSDVSMM